MELTISLDESSGPAQAQLGLELCSPGGSQTPVGSLGSGGSGSPAHCDPANTTMGWLSPAGACAQKCLPKELSWCRRLEAMALLSPLCFAARASVQRGRPQDGEDGDDVHHQLPAGVQNQGRMGTAFLSSELGTSPAWSSHSGSCQEVICCGMTEIKTSGQVSSF